MSNLLPATAQRALFNRTLSRAVIVGAFLLVLVSSIGMLALLPGYLLLHTERNTTAYELSRLKEGMSAQAQADREALSSTNKRLKILQGFDQEKARISEAVRTVIESRPSGMTMRRMSYEAMSYSTSTKPMLTISGIVKDRNDQAIYLARLEDSPLFSSVEIPIAALALTEAGAVTFIVHGDF